MGEQLGYGMIACGRISAAHIGAAEEYEGVRLVAVADPDQEKARVAADRCAQAPVIYADYRDLLADDAVDVVVIGVPTHMHRDVALDAAAAGKHIYCEKAMAHTLRGAREMMAGRDEHGVKLMIGQSTRFQPQFAMARRVIESGAIGEVYAVNARFTGAANSPDFGATDSWRYQAQSAGNGHIINFGCHYIDTARFLSGHDPVRVSAWIDNFFSEGMIQEDQFAVTARCDGDAVIDIALYSPPAQIYAPSDGYMIFGTEGFIEARQRGQDITVTDADGSEQVEPDDDLLAESTFVRIHRLLCESILNDTAEPVTGEDALVNLEWGLAAYLSGERDEWMDLPLAADYADYAGPQLARSIPATRER